MYESYFNFTEKPFKLSPEPKFFFETPHHKKAVSYLKYGLSLGEGFIVITGPIGTGKTTIAKNLISSLDESFTAIQIVTTKLSPEELVGVVACQFGIETEGLDKALILKRIEKHLISLYNSGKRAILIIDEAQNLPSESVEELRMLSNFNIDDRPLIQSFLLGQEELKTIISLPQMEQFRQRIIASCHLRPLNNDETQSYITHRLEKVGWEGIPSIHVDSFKLICKHTNGVPRKINIFMDRLFLYAFMSELESISVKDVGEVIDEMNTEISGDLQTTNQLSKPMNEVESLSDRDRSEDIDFIKNQSLRKTIVDVSLILDGVIKAKTKTIHNLDKIIADKRKQISENTIETNDKKLEKRSWVKLLMKEREI
ncbi:AAA family ATPase [Photobacterium sp. BZF1]|uniref:XrtA/PEP-CTERM system-associated ATPase n=1 Tax=Photobacterium sp. BZF1 TaxID=1904457 RepID=UPI001653DAD6|nr:XrtA/PEP-CTERM system-associated ATPase [Photobacterium sp. BZF1]MBC7004730.1 AAA family ATPase [Photobacterium sp. BZF1]